jgi:hypothetical protein
MSPSLHEFQQGFAQALLADDQAPPDAIARLAAQPGFAVYRNTVLRGCVDALLANYPAVTRLVGEEWMRAAAAVYARVRLLAQPMLLDYGADFAAFLAGFEPAVELPYLPGVATLDRLWIEAHCAADAPAASPAALRALAPQALAALRLAPHPAARWRWFEAQPIHTIWQRNREAGHSDTELDWRSEGALLTRPDEAVQAQALGRGGCAFLDACAAGLTLGEAAQAALTTDPEIDLPRLIALLLDAGALAAPATEF